MLAKGTLLPIVFTFIAFSHLSPTSSALSDEFFPLPNDQLWGDDTMVAVTPSVILLCSPSLPTRLSALRRHTLFGWQPLNMDPFVYAPAMPDEFTCSRIAPVEDGMFYLWTEGGDLFLLEVIGRPDDYFFDFSQENLVTLESRPNRGFNGTDWYDAARAPYWGAPFVTGPFGLPMQGSGGLVVSSELLEPEPSEPDARCGTSVDAAAGHGQSPVLIGCPGGPSAWLSYWVKNDTSNERDRVLLELPLPDFINTTDSDFGAMVAIPDSYNSFLIEAHYVLAVAAPSAGNITFYWMERVGNLNYDYTGNVDIVTTVSAPGSNVRPIVWMRPTEQAVVFMTEDLSVFVASVVWRDRTPSVEVEDLGYDVDSADGISVTDNGMIALVQSGELHVIRLLCGDGFREDFEVCDGALFCTEFCTTDGTFFSAVWVGSFLFVSGLLLMLCIPHRRFAVETFFARTTRSHIRAGHADVLRVLALIWIPAGLVTLWALMEAATIDRWLSESALGLAFGTLLPAALLWLTAELGTKPWAALAGGLAFASHIAWVVWVAVVADLTSGLWWGPNASPVYLHFQSASQLISLALFFAIHMLLGSAGLLYICARKTSWPFPRILLGSLLWPVVVCGFATL